MIIDTDEIEPLLAGRGCELVVAELGRAQKAIGLAMGLGGVAAVALGGVADAVDLKTALVCSAFAPLAGVGLCFFLPAPKQATPVAVQGGAPLTVPSK